MEKEKNFKKKKENLQCGTNLKTKKERKNFSFNALFNFQQARHRKKSLIIQLINQFYK